MTWLQRYRVRYYLRNSMWVLPVATMLGAVILARALHWLQVEMGWVSDSNPDSVRAVLGTLAGAMFTFIVFFCSSLLLVVQLASAQFTPRIISLLFRDRGMKLTLSLFVFTFAFAISALIRTSSSVPLLTLEITVYSSAICLGVSLYLVDRVSKTLRPNGALQAVASQAHPVIESVYPRRLKMDETESRESLALGAEAPRTVSSLKAGVVLAFDLPGLVAIGARRDCVIELVPQVGNFVAPGNPLFRVHRAGDGSWDFLRDSIALGPERTMEQDPAFAFRVIVDIASKGLSPAINDPTTAVLAIDRIHHLLRHVGSRRLDTETARDAAGQVRLVYRTPDWEDFVTLAVTEIRHFGGTSIQVTRRLRAMLEDLILYLPKIRIPSLQHQLKLLNRSAERFFPEPEDRVLADESDSQGVGGAQEYSQIKSPGR